MLFGPEILFLYSPSDFVVIVARDRKKKEEEELVLQRGVKQCLRPLCSNTWVFPRFSRN